MIQGTVGALLLRKITLWRAGRKDDSLETYFNRAESPDFASIENCWQAPTVYVQKRRYFDEQSLIELLSEG